jgi:hypothetical protein
MEFRAHTAALQPVMLGQDMHGHHEKLAGLASCQVRRGVESRISRLTLYRQQRRYFSSLI